MMKTFLIVCGLLFTTGLFAQGVAVIDTDTAGNDKMVTYSLKEVVINGSASEIVLGEFDVKSKKGNVVVPDGEITCYFENIIGKSFLKSFFVKVQKVKFKTEARIVFYKRHNYIQEYCLNKDGIKPPSYETFIPGEKITTEEILVTLMPGQKGIVEFDLSKYNIALPAEGLFVSLEGKGYFDANDNAVPNTTIKLKDKTWVDFHATTKDNFCEWSHAQGSQSYFWSNVNMRIKNDFEIAFKKKPSESILVAPNFGLKVVRK